MLTGTTSFGAFAFSSTSTVNLTSLAGGTGGRASARAGDAIGPRPNAVRAATHNRRMGASGSGGDSDGTRPSRSRQTVVTGRRVRARRRARIAGTPEPSGEGA